MRAVNRTSRIAFPDRVMNAVASWACAALVLAQALLPMGHALQHGPDASDSGSPTHAESALQADSGALAWSAHEHTGKAHDPAHCVLCSLARNGQTNLRSDLTTHLAEPSANGSLAEPTARPTERFISLNDAPPRGPPFVS